MISLGCAKNQVNAEQMLYRLQQAGYTLQEDVDGADLVIVNTCGFIESAKSEAIDNILQLAHLKEKGKLKSCWWPAVCPSAIRGDPRGAAEVDGMLGTGSYTDVVRAVEELMAGDGNITVWINSPGGDCVAAAQIYNMLMDYKATSRSRSMALRRLLQV